MHTSVITRFAKNDRAFSGRRRIAALAATAVLAGGVQVLAMSDTAWACGDARYDTPPAVTGGVMQQAPSGDFRAPFTNTLTADGGWTEYSVEMANFTGGDLPKVTPSFSLSSLSHTALRVKDVRVEVMQNGAWKPLKVNAGCIGLDADTNSLTQPLSNGRAANFMFRVSLSPNTPQDVTELAVVTDAYANNGNEGHWGNRSVKVLHPKTAEAKPASAAKPAPTKPAKPAAAVPAADNTPAEKPAEKAPAEKPAAAAAPATTAPAGTPELAHTGAAENNTFLAVSSAALLALGGGVLIAVRRLRPRR
ncbi:LPXTG cell wall anchor domain-containing protein [Kitasatospora sp. NPDC004669]|uniref:LPXTG cell wall anchor domain-containing protein n=1 Tax=Kitasatospora sp. NPDC004669 TaxID=3154555 RepID=UPI0033B5AC95